MITATYVITTVKGQPKNRWGGRDLKELGRLKATSRKEAQRVGRKQFDDTTAYAMHITDYDGLQRAGETIAKEEDMGRAARLGAKPL